MTDVILKDPVLDGGIEVLNTVADAIWVCDGTPVDFSDADTKNLGVRSFGAGNVFGNPTNASPNGRQVTSVPVTDGTVSYSGTVTCWAVVDTVNDVLLAVGNLTGGMAVTAGWAWTLDAFTIRVPAAAAPAYEGPGDVVSGATVWWGLRAYSAATAAALAPCIDVVKTSDGSATTTINLLANGDLDVATIAALGYGVSVSKIYDQVGSNHLVQATLAKMPVLGLSVFGTRPALQGSYAADRHLKIASFTLGGTITQPYSMSWVARKTSDTGDLGTVLAWQDSGILTGFHATTTLVYLYGGSLPTVTAAYNTLHSVHAIFDSTASELVVDGASTTVNSGGSGSSISTGHIVQFGSDDSTRAVPGEYCEAGLWPLKFNSGEEAALFANQQTYWGI